MFGFRRKRKLRLAPVNDLISEHVEIKDNYITFSGGMYLNGVIHMEIQPASGNRADLVINENGKVFGNVKITNARVAGYISGSLYVEDTVELLPTAVIDGNLHCSVLIRNDGATIKGKITEANESFTR